MTRAKDRFGIGLRAFEVGYRNRDLSQSKTFR